MTLQSNDDVTHRIEHPATAVSWRWNVGSHATPGRWPASMRCAVGASSAPVATYPIVQVSYRVGATRAGLSRPGSGNRDRSLVGAEQLQHRRDGFKGRNRRGSREERDLRVATIAERS